MAAQPGKNILLQVNTSGTIYADAAGLRTKSVRLNKELVDITNSDSPGRWREALAGATVKSLSLQGSGVFLDSAVDETIRANFNTDTAMPMKVIIPDFGTWSGNFMLTSLENAGEHNGEVTYSMTWESAGTLAWATTTT
jgi:TP901-1 family phage major tail protein